MSKLTIRICCIFAVGGLAVAPGAAASALKSLAEANNRAYEEARQQGRKANPSEINSIYQRHEAPAQQKLRAERSQKTKEYIKAAKKSLAPIKKQLLSRKLDPSMQNQVDVADDEPVKSKPAATKARSSGASTVEFGGTAGAKEIQFGTSRPSEGPKVQDGIIMER